MATSPNYNWPEPDNTDLVKNGALAIRTAVNAIDSSLAELKGGTTGQVLSKTSATDMDFTWVTTDDANAIQNSIVDAKGDLIAATANDTPARLAVGTNGQALVADSTAATGLAYGNKGYTLLSTTALSGATVSVTGIPQTYQELMILVYEQTNATTNGKIRVGVNSSTTFGYYTGLETAVAGSFAGTYITVADDKAAASAVQSLCAKIDRYSSTLLSKPTQYFGYYVNPSGAARIITYGGISYGTGAITSVQVSNSGGNQTGGTVEIWGLN